jgi:hypothetical protein
MVALSHARRITDLWVLRAWLWALSLLGVIAAESAHAEDRPWRCGESLRPWVELRFDGNGWEPRLQQTIRADMAAGLRLRGLLVCPVDKPGVEAPLASVQLSAASITKVAVEIEVHDALTNKYVMREVDMRNVTVDARGLTLAAAAEELLRASWAELALEDAPPPAREPPPEVTAAVRPSLSQRDDHVLGLRVIGEHHAGGHTQVGPEVWFDVWLTDHFAAELSIGYRRGLDVSADHGSIASQAAVLGADALLAFAGRGSRLLLLTRFGFQVANMEFEGTPERGSVGLGRSGINVAARAGLVLRVALGHTAELRLEAGPGISMRSLAVYDGREEVTGTRGVHGHAELGFGAVF